MDLLQDAIRKAKRGADKHSLACYIEPTAFGLHLGYREPAKFQPSYRVNPDGMIYYRERFGDWQHVEIRSFSSCTHAADPPAPAAEQDLSPALEESIRRVQQARRDAPRPCSICRQTHGSEIVHECE